MSQRPAGFLLSAAALALVLAPAPARAESIDFLGLGRHSIVTINSPISGTFYAGELTWSWLPDGGQPSFFTYCVDVMNAVVDPQYVTVESTNSLTAGAPDAGGKAAWLVNTFGWNIHNYGTGVQAAALQLAVWEAIYDTTNSLSSGLFSIGSSTYAPIIDQAQAYLGALYYAPNAYHTSTGTWLNTARGQDQIMVPEPPLTLLLLASTLFMAWRFRPARFGSWNTLSVRRVITCAVVALTALPSVAWANVPVDMPEPSSMLLVGVGLGALALRRFRGR